MWEFKFSTDDVEKYIKDKYDEAKDYLTDIVDETAESIKDIIKPKELIETEEDFEPTDEDKDIFEKIDEIDDSQELTDDQKTLIQEFCEKFTRICKAFDLLDEEMKVRNLDCHEDTEFCEKLHKFLDHVSKEYEKLKDLSLKDLADKAK